MATLQHDEEVRDLATLLISRYGVRAVTYASHQALKARHRGETMRMEAWRWIADAAAQAWQAEPEDGRRGFTVQPHR
jgi:hypothetical protein